MKWGGGVKGGEGGGGGMVKGVKGAGEGVRH